MSFQDPNRPGPPGWGQPPAGPPPAHFGSPPGAPPPAPNTGGDRSTAVLVLGVVSGAVMFVMCSACGPLCLLSLGFSIPAILIARADLRGIDEGRIAATQRGTLQAGLVVAIVSTVLSALLGLAYLVLIAIYGGLLGTMVLMDHH